VSPSVGERINKAVNLVLQGATPGRSKALHNLRDLALRTLADKVTL
jgi:hypothetical protein